VEDRNRAGVCAVLGEKAQNAKNGQQYGLGGGAGFVLIAGSWTGWEKDWLAVATVVITPLQ